MTESKHSGSQPITTLSEEEIQKTGKYFSDNDFAAQTMGIKLISISDGSATVEMTVSKIHLNAHSTCHGGVTFLLADTAFSYACNSCGLQTVGLDCQINYLLGARQGDKLTAIATEENRTNRTGVYSVRVINQDHELVALFRGQAYCMRKPHQFS